MQYMASVDMLSAECLGGRVGILDRELLYKGKQAELA